MQTMNQGEFRWNLFATNGSNFKVAHMTMVCVRATCVPAYVRAGAVKSEMYELDFFSARHYFPIQKYSKFHWTHTQATPTGALAPYIFSSPLHLLSV